MLDSTNPLLYCVEAIVNSLSSVSHVCPSSTAGPAQPPLIDITKSLNLSYPESPSSPFVSDSLSLSLVESSLKSRPSGFERKPLDTVPEESGSFSHSSRGLTKRESGASINISPTKPQHSVSVTSLASTFTSSASTEHMSNLCEGGMGGVGGCGLGSPATGLCAVCGSPTNAYGEEVCSLSVLCLGTCCHRFPSLVSGHLVDWAISCIAKCVWMCFTVLVFFFSLYLSFFSLHFSGLPSLVIIFGRVTG